jgi:hypothetical protein
MREKEVRTININELLIFNRASLRLKAARIKNLIKAKGSY